MIQANELRIGNWINIQSHNQYAQIIEIKSGRPDNRDFVRISSPNLDTQFAVEISQINPIPLTEEILLKAGFEKESEDDKYGRVFLIPDTKYIIRIVNYGNPQKVDFGYSLEISDNKDWCGIKRIYFLHDLQNTIFALTGEDIKIEV